VAALYISQYLSERRGEDPNHVWGLLPILLVFGIFFARLWYVINTWEKYREHLFSFGDPNYPGFFEVWRGGIAIQGAVIGGIFAMLIYKVFTGIKFLRWADFIAPGLILAQALGRWGNFFNNEAYGNQTDLPWGVQIPCEYRTRGLTPGTLDTSCPTVSESALFHPTFFYESVWNYAVFLVLLYLIMYPKRVQKALKIRLRDGDIFLAYLVLYSIGRFMVEALRTDPLYIIGDPVNGGIRSAQMLSIISIFVGSVWFIARHRARPTRDDEALSVRTVTRKAQLAGTEEEEYVEDEALEETKEEVPEMSAAKNEEEIEPVADADETTETTDSTGSDEANEAETPKKKK
jgi:phosphatidylglycerol:prolipoprotein diacylglycerol transferase